MTDQVVDIHFPMDKDLKQQMEAVCSHMGLSLTAAFTIFARQMSREQRIPFEIASDPFFSKENMAHLENVAARINTGAARLSEHDLIEAD